MTIEKWKELYEILDRQFQEFLIYYPEMKSGKKQKIRKTAITKVDNCIDLCCIWIRENVEAYRLLTGENLNDQGRFYNWDEFKLPRYFRTDMPKFLENVKTRIKSLEEG